MTLTDIGIRALPFPEKGQSKTYFDTVVTGLGVRVSHGAKTYVLVYGKARRRVKIGGTDLLSLKDARAKAKAFLAQKTLDPHETPSIPFTHALEQYLATRKTKNKPRTYEETKRLLEKYLLPTFRHDKMAGIAKHELLERIDKIGGSEGAHCLTAAKTFFRWSTRRGYLKYNPLHDAEPQQPGKPRSRLLTDDEFLAVWRACDELDTYGKIVRLCFATGQRKTQIAHLHSKWLDGSGISFPGDIMKHSLPHFVPYSTLTLGLLPQHEGLLFPARGRVTPFNGWSKCKKALNKLVDIAPWVIHDARRFYSSTHSKLGTAPHVREMLLGHLVGTKVSRTYDVYAYKAEKTEAQLKYEAHLSILVNP